MVCVLAAVMGMVRRGRITSLHVVAAVSAWGWEREVREMREGTVWLRTVRVSHSV